MRSRYIVLSAMVALACIGSLPVMSSGVFLDGQKYFLAKLDADEAMELKQSGQIMSLETLIAQVQKNYPGQIIEIKLDEKDDRYVYEIEVVDNEGVVIELTIDAATGEVLRYKKDY